MPDAPSDVEVPAFDEGPKLHQYIEQEFGRDTLDALRKSQTNNERHIALLTAVQRKFPQLNGRATDVVQRLLLNQQELDRKESWFTRILKAPGRALSWTWGKMKEHPYLTIGAVIALLAAVAGVAYYSGGIELLLRKLGVSTTGVIGDTIKDLPIEPGGTMPQAPDFFGVD